MSETLERPSIVISRNGDNEQFFPNDDIWKKVRSLLMRKELLTKKIIMDAILEYTGSTVLAVKSNSRKRNDVRARRLYCFLTYHLTLDSVIKIGGDLGIDHSSVSYHNATLLDLFETDRETMIDIYHFREAFCNFYKEGHINKRDKREEAALSGYFM